MLKHVPSPRRLYHQYISSSSFTYTKNNLITMHPTSGTMKYAVKPPAETLIPVVVSDGTADDDGNNRNNNRNNLTDESSSMAVVYPVRRIYCVGRNYADHAREMGGDPDREMPFFFTKPRDAIVVCDAQGRAPTDISDTTSTITTIPPATAAPTTTCCPAPTTQIRYPQGTKNLHYEIELVIAIGKEGVSIPLPEAGQYVYGFAVGVDLTRRDLQNDAKKTGRPWDCSKGFDHSAPISFIYRCGEGDGCTRLRLHDSDDGETKASSSSSLWLNVNGQRKQTGQLGQMIWSVEEIISILSQQFTLYPGDLIFTGTPSGVGPLLPGDIVQGGVEGLADIAFQIVDSLTTDKTS